MGSLRLKIAGILVVSLIAISIFIWSLPMFLVYVLNEPTQIETNIFDLINEERVSRGLPALLKDEALTSIALEWSAHMAEINDITHGDFEDRMASIGYSQYQCREIIAMCQGWTQNLGRRFVDMWLDSPGHYPAMMTPKNGYMGVGVSEGQGFFAVVDFRFMDS